MALMKANGLRKPDLSNVPGLSQDRNRNEKPNTKKGTQNQSWLQGHNAKLKCEITE